MAKTFVGAFHETDVFVGYFAYEEGFVEVAVVTFVVDGDVQIHDVAALQLARTTSLTELDVMRIESVKVRAHALREEIVVQWRGIGISLHTLIKHDFINFIGCNSGSHCTSGYVEDFATHAASSTHSLDVSR